MIKESIPIVKSDVIVFKKKLKNRINTADEVFFRSFEF